MGVSNYQCPNSMLVKLNSIGKRVSDILFNNVMLISSWNKCFPKNDTSEVVRFLIFCCWKASEKVLSQLWKKIEFQTEKRKMSCKMSLWWRKYWRLSRIKESYTCVTQHVITTWRRHHMETLSVLLALWQENSATDYWGVPSQRVSKAELWCLTCCNLRGTRFEQSVKLSVIWDVMKHFKINVKEFSRIKKAPITCWGLWWHLANNYGHDWKELKHHSLNQIRII